MSRSQVPKAISHAPALWAALLFIVMLIGNLLLLVGRTREGMRSDFLLGIAPTFYSHVSNFSISYLLYSSIGYAWLMMGARARPILLLGLVLVLCNLVYEFFIPVLNTPDPIDAWYGVAGTVLGAVVLMLIGRFGMVLMPPSGAAKPES